MLRMCLNISWEQKLTNEQLYEDLPAVTEKIKTRRMKLAAHCVRHPDTVASKLVLWECTRGQRNRGRPKMPYIDNLKSDAGHTDVGELRSRMIDREGWRVLSGLVRAGARRK
ncbi:hypothetical protein Bbelb_331560 [Branchiostoma belcheri]|nr:hypothetical protein Bbelb_331560 [Branchiostoma belcheri]